jgi:hypothetical protein
MMLFVEGGDDLNKGAKREISPVLAVPVYVQCDGFRSLAYRDKEGVWRHFYGDQPIEGIVSPVPYEAK